MSPQKNFPQIKLTAYAVLPYNDGFVYVVTSKDGKIGLPGGKLESFEGAADALTREVAEEIGVEVVLDRILGLWQFKSGKGNPIASIIYRGKIVEGTPKIIRPSEIKKIIYPTLSEVRAFYREGKLRSNEISLRPLERFLSGVSFPLEFVQTHNLG